ncbi:MAG: hypothetical protein KBG92_01845 [Spirochaetes bacterium]|nr:hypothetical protein [Spirochaetota bacterium]MBP8986522.1 hypothetical protein [Spirochaetota bacterium]HQL43356.1 hypothetical protein [Spirochaetota bacterium]
MDNEDAKGGFPGKLTVNLVLKVICVALVIIAALWLIFNIQDYGKANLIISNQEITSNDQSSVSKFSNNDKVYFFVDRIMKSKLDCDTVTISLYYFENDSYAQYKQITFEVDKDFPKLSTYIPDEYFKRHGQYQIKVLLDGKVVATKEFKFGE